MEHALYTLALHSASHFEIIRKLKVPTACSQWLPRTLWRGQDGNVSVQQNHRHFPKAWPLALLHHVAPQFFSHHTDQDVPSHIKILSATKLALMTFAFKYGKIHWRAPAASCWGGQFHLWSGHSGRQPLSSPAGMGNSWRNGNGSCNRWSSAANHGAWRCPCWTIGTNHSIWGFPSMGIPQNRWCIMENPIETDDDWGYPYFRKPPYCQSQKTQRADHLFGGFTGRKPERPASGEIVSFGPAGESARPIPSAPCDRSVEITACSLVFGERSGMWSFSKLIRLPKAIFLLPRDQLQLVRDFSSRSGLFSCISSTHWLWFKITPNHEMRS